MWLKINVVHRWFVGILYVVDCGLLMDNIVIYVDDEMTILVVICFRYIVWNVVSHVH